MFYIEKIEIIDHKNVIEIDIEKCIKVNVIIEIIMLPHQIEKM
jgi:hypothetical protein